MAKRYIEPVGRDVYFEDVRLQMEAKLWGEEYNRHKPPKQVRGSPTQNLPHQDSRAQPCQSPTSSSWCHSLTY